MSVTDSHYDAIVVGSGFGGSVTAYRLAEAGKRVCVLERGRAVPARLVHAQPVPRARELLGPAARPDRHVPLLVVPAGSTRSSRPGLGGGSLIYANVFIRKDEKWFVQEDLNDGGYEYWPVTRADLDPHYDRVEQMIGLQRYPFDHEPYALDAEDDRLQGGRRGATASSGSCRQLAVTFANEGRAAGAGRGDRGGAPEPARPHRARPASCAASATSAATTAPRTRSTTTTSRTPSTTAPRSARCATCARFEPRDGGGYAVALRRPRRRTRAEARRRPPPLRRSPATTWCSAPARSARPTCCCATAAPSRASAASSARASAATATC